MSDDLNNLWKAHKSLESDHGDLRERVAVAEARIEQHADEFRVMNRENSAQFSKLETQLEGYGTQLQAFMNQYSTKQGERVGAKNAAAWIIATSIAMAGVLVALLNYLS